MDEMNLILVISDQHNSRILGYAGNREIQTPNLDAMAKGGVYFRSAYCASPLCVPARASLATGQYVHRIGAWDNASPYLGVPKSWGHVLQARGTKVTTVGKLHYRRVDDDTGFTDQLVPMHVKDGVGALASLVRDRRGQSKQMVKVLNEAGPGESEYTAYDRTVGDTARQWLYDVGSKLKDPWVLVVGFVAPHFPLVAPKKFFDLYSEVDVKLPTAHDGNPHPVIGELRAIKGLDFDVSDETLLRAKRAYYGLTSFLDNQIGQLLSTVEELNLCERTRVMYTSDHGEMLGEHGIWGKSVLYEGSVGIPLILKGPDQPAGLVVDEPVSGVDIFPTVLEALGASFDLNGFPGMSLWRYSSTRDGLDFQVQQDRAVFSEYHGGGAPVGMYMIRCGKWKLIYYVGADSELFDLENDPNESYDLSHTTEGARVVQRMESSLRSIVDPEEVDARAKHDQNLLLESHGGIESILSTDRFFHTPVPKVTA